MDILYDYIIVGAGIAGLYAYNTLKTPNNNILVLEESGRVGGRMGQDQFYGTTVSIGAGIGRKSKDHLLIKLLKQHNIKYHEFSVQKRWLTVMQENESRAIVQKLKHAYNNTTDRGQTFKEYAVRVLGQPLYNKFMKHYEYTDMERADVYETLFHYGLEDNANGWIGLSIPWNQLLNKMTPPSSDIILKHRVQKIHRACKNMWLIDQQYYCKNVILATTVSTVKKILPMHRQIYNQVESQPFMRIYGKFNKENARKMAEATGGVSTIVNNHIKRIIPMSEDVYMIVYSDNANAKHVEKYVTGNNEESRDWLNRKLEQALSVPVQVSAIKRYYWEEGTHYYVPFVGTNTYDKWIRDAHNPEPGIYVVGEMVSRDQGWVEGALQSVAKL